LNKILLRSYKQPIGLIAGGLLVLLFAIGNLKYGVTHFNGYDLLSAFFHTDLSLVSHITLIEVRLPMVLMAIIAGASLAISGLLLQRVTQNPLACPSLSGVEYGTACCVILCYMFIPHVSKLGIMCISLMGGLFTYLLTQAIVKKIGATTTGITLIGIAFDALYFSLIQAILLAFPYQAQSILYDLNGSLQGITFNDIGLVALPFVVLFIVVLLLGKRLDLLNLDELQASALGVSIKPYRLIMLAVSIILATLVTSLIGPLLFFSLVVPHLVRSLTSSRYIILFCAIYGAALLLMAQLLTYLVSPLTPPPVGLVMLLIAAPMLTIIIRRHLPYDER